MLTSPLWDEFRAEGREEGLAKGKVAGARALLLQVGRRKFGRAPTRKQREELEAVADLTRLEEMGERLFDVGSWCELLNGH